MTAYVSEFLAAIRHPEHEAGQQSTFHVVLTEWAPDALGNVQPRTVGPIGPEQAERAGFPLEKILGEVVTAAVRDRDAANAEKAAALSELSEAQEKALNAEKSAREAISVAVNAAVDKAKADEQIAALVARVAELEAPKASLLNKLTFGLIDKPE